MRKRYWVVLAFLALAGLGNLIGGTDTPGRAAVDPAGGTASVRADIPAAPRFDATLFVSASSLNLREAPTTGGRVLTSLPRNTRVLAGERRSGWVLVSARGQVGWVSEQYLVGAPVRYFSASAEPAGLRCGAEAQRGVRPVAPILHPDRLMPGSAVVPGQLQLGRVAGQR